MKPAENTIYLYEIIIIVYEIFVVRPLLSYQWYAIREPFYRCVKGDDWEQMAMKELLCSLLVKMKCL